MHPSGWVTIPVHVAKWSGIDILPASDFGKCVNLMEDDSGISPSNLHGAVCIWAVALPIWL